MNSSCDLCQGPISRHIPQSTLDAISPGWIDLGMEPVRLFDTESWTTFWAIGVWTVERHRTDQCFRWFTSYPGIGESLDAFCIWVNSAPACWVGFNSIGYDNAMVAAVLAGERDPAALNRLNTRIIRGDARTWTREFVATGEHIDLYQMYKGFRGPLGGLKWCLIKCDYPVLQESPFPFTQAIEPDEMVVAIRDYNLHDVCGLGWILRTQVEAIRMRAWLSAQYDIDVTNTADSGLAEAILRRRMFGSDRVPGYAWPTTKRWKVDVGEVLEEFSYDDPELAAMRAALSTWRIDYTEERIEKDDGSVERKIRRSKRRHDFHFGESTCRVGLGGAHSIDPPGVIEADRDWAILDCDISAFYPMIVHRFGLRPGHLPDSFNKVFAELIAQREAAVAAGDTLGAQALKVSNNSVYGKTGSCYSFLCDPALTARVCLIGQQIIFSAIEYAKLAANDAHSVQCISVNTDGATLKVRRHLVAEVRARMQRAAENYGMTVKTVEYERIARRDGNNFIAVDTAGNVKARGALGYRRGDITRSAQERIVVDAAAAYLLKGTPVEDTIAACNDIREYLAAFKTAKGWFLCDSAGVEELGTMARWVHVRHDVADACTLYKCDPDTKHLGYRVMKVAGAGPAVRLMPILPFDYRAPADLDRAHYAEKALRLAKSVLEPEAKRNDLLAQADLSAEQLALFEANAACREPDLAKCARLDLTRFIERYSEKRRGNPHDSMNAVLMWLWCSHPGQLSLGDLFWCAQRISEEVDDHFATRLEKLEDMCEHFACEVPAFPRPVTPADALAHLLPIVTAEGKIEVVRPKKLVYHRTINDTVYLTSVMKTNYKRTRNMHQLTYAVLARCVRYSIPLEIDTLTQVLTEVENFYAG